MLTNWRNFMKVLILAGVCTLALFQIGCSDRNQQSFESVNQNAVTDEGLRIVPVQLDKSNVETVFYALHDCGQKSLRRLKRNCGPGHSSLSLPGVTLEASPLNPNNKMLRLVRPGEGTYSISVYNGSTVLMNDAGTFTQISASKVAELDKILVQFISDYKLDELPTEFPGWGQK